MTIEPIDYGFRYGSAEVTRLVSDHAKGWVLVGVKTPKQEIQIYVTRTGKIRVHSVSGGEWKLKEE